MYSVQAALFDFETFIQLDATNRLRLVLDTLNIEAFLTHLDGRHRWVGRRGYGARTLWACLIVGIVYTIPTIAELRRHLQVSAELRLLCGLGRAARIPSAATFSRFLTLLAAHPEVLDPAFQELVQRFQTAAPDFGQGLGFDSSDVHAAANGHRRQPGDPDARWGVKHKPGGSKDEPLPTLVSTEIRRLAPLTAIPGDQPWQRRTCHLAGAHQCLGGRVARGQSSRVLR